MTTRHIAGLAVWLVVVGLLVVGVATSAKLARPLYWAVGLIGALALFSAFSALWSGSVELSLIEADRVLVYLGFFIATFLIAQTDERRQRFAEGMVVGLAAVAILALASRLLPDLLQLAEPGGGPRLRYPLGYWNANGAMFAVAIAMLLWACRRATWPALRWFSAGAIPAVLLALYFTYSRGGLVTLAIAAGIVIVLSRDRLWMLSTLAVGALGALPAVLAVQSRRSLAENFPDSSAVDQGATVALILLAGIALTVLLFAVLRRLERREGRLTGRAVELSRSPKVLRGFALGGAVLAIAATVAVGGRAWDRFTDSDLQFPAGQPESHFSNLGGAGRSEFWGVAIDSFGEQPLRGIGAGTYEFAWERNRDIDQPVHNAHSLYLESFAELGAIGGLLVLALVAGMLWWAFAAWRAAAGPSRELLAVACAGLAGFAVAAALDWVWELAAVAAVFFLLGGLAVAARCSQLAAAAPPRRGQDRSWALAAGGLAVAWIAAIALVGPLLVEHELDASRAAAADENLIGAVDHAERARSIEPWAASPYVQLGQLAGLRGDYAAAIDYMSEAIEREDQNWQWYYLRSTFEREAGEPAAARADLERARRLNPRSGCLRDGNCG